MEFLPDNHLLFEAPTVRQFTSPAAWTPATLSALVAWWNADDHGTANMTDDGAGLISVWKDRVNAVSTTAATTARPTYGATAFNSAYAGVTFDGTANALTTTSFAAIPTGSTAREIWVVADQQAASGTQRIIVSYGAAAAGQDVILNRPAAGTKVQFSDNALTYTDTLVTLSGPHFFGFGLTGTTASGRADGAPMSPASGTITSLATGTVRFRIGSRDNASVGSLWQGPLRHLFVFNAILTLVQQQQLEGWIAWNSGLTSLLPANHPYKNGLP